MMQIIANMYFFLLSTVQTYVHSCTTPNNSSTLRWLHGQQIKNTTLRILNSGFSQRRTDLLTYRNQGMTSSHGLHMHYSPAHAITKFTVW